MGARASRRRRAKRRVRGGRWPRHGGKKMGGVCGHPVGGEVIVTNPDRTRDPSGGIPSLRSLLLHVLPLERLGLGQGPLRVLHLLELLGDGRVIPVQEIADRRSHGLRTAREVVDLHEEVESLQVARGQAQRDLLRVRIPHLDRPTAYVKPTPFDRRLSGGNVSSLYNDCWRVLRGRNSGSCRTYPSLLSWRWRTAPEPSYRHVTGTSSVRYR